MQLLILIEEANKLRFVIMSIRCNICCVAFCLMCAPNIHIITVSIQYHYPLSGLYTPTRGPHSYWLRNGTVDSNADGVVNMLHYEDAASVIIAALKSG